MNRVFFYLLSFALMYSCANPVAPTGGEKDTEPPVLLTNKPLNGTTNLSEGKIELTFNEYIQLTKTEDKLLIIPPMAVKPTFIIKGKKILIKLPDNLAENTTYNFTFLGAIRDYNENNATEYLSYVFSTGDKIDSSSISGTVKLAADNSVVEKATVGLYLATDTGILTDIKPRYLAKTNSSGQFKINFIKDGEYRLAVIKEENNNLLYDKESEKVSLITNPILIEGNVVLEQELIIFQSEPKIKVLDYALKGNNKVAIAFSKPVAVLQLDIDNYNVNDVFYFNELQDTLFYHWSDTSLTAANYYFELNNEVKDTLQVSYAGNRLKTKISLAKNEIFSNGSLVVQFPFIITSVDENKVFIKDSINNINYKYNIEKNLMYFESEFESNKAYEIQFDSTAVKYFNGFVNDKKVLIFNATEAISLGNLILSLDYIKQNNLVLHLLNKTGVIVKQISIDNTTDLTIKNLEPGAYSLKIFKDTNGNMKWDTGSFYENREPEKNLVFIKSIDIKNNWDKDLQINF